jgi:glycosyltransferase involved in cell wall biosynthesis
MANKPAAAIVPSAIPALLRLTGLRVHVTLHAFSENVNFDDAGVRFPALYRFGARLATRLLLLTDGVHVLLPSYKEKIVRTFGAVGAKVFVHPHGTFDYQPSNAVVERRPDVILAFGSWGTYKRVEDLVEAFRIVRGRLPSAELWIAGGDHPKARGYLEECANKYRDEAGVSFLGYIEEQYVAELFRTVSVAVLPYRSSAGSSGVLHLACEYETPIVAADIPDLRETAEFEGLWLEFFPPGSVEKLSDQLVRVLSDSRLRLQIAKQNREAVRNLSLREVVGEYLRIFAEGRRSPARVVLTHPEAAAEEASSSQAL